MHLTAKEIRIILNVLSERTIIEPTLEFPYRVTQHQTGYSDNDVISKLQGKLSIMLEVAAGRGE
jgi:hypothetical protein